jgi:hypothetical protein
MNQYCNHQITPAFVEKDPENMDVDVSPYPSEHVPVHRAARMTSRIST